MKRVIGGKVYNTETATLIAEECGSPGELTCWNEQLYRTIKGAWFLYGHGGPASGWSKSSGQNSWSSGDGIEVLTERGALEWCERRRISADIIIEHFAGVQLA